MPPRLTPCPPDCLPDDNDPGHTELTGLEGGVCAITNTDPLTILGICSNINVAERAQKLRREQKREGEE